MPIENENGSESAEKLNKIAIKNKINSETAYNFKDALKKISSNEKNLLWYLAAFTIVDQY